MKKFQFFSKCLPFQSWRAVRGMSKMATFKEDFSNTNAMNNIGDKAFYMKKENALSLGKFKVVYARDGADAAETIIIRNLYGEAKENQSIFGMAGIDNISKLFLSLIAICHDNKKWIRKGAQFLDQAELDEVTDVYIENKHNLDQLKNFTTNASEYIQFEVKNLIGIGGNDSSIVKVEFNRERMIFSLSFYIAEGVFRNRVYLFATEIIKLMRYLNSRFEFSEVDSLKLKAKEIMKEEAIDFSKDNFF